MGFLFDRVSILVKGNARLLVLSVTWRHNEKAVVCRPGTGVSPGIELELILDILASRSVRKQIFVQATQSVVLYSGSLS